MQQTQLGAHGPAISRLWLGMMSFGDPAWQGWVQDEAAAISLVATALELGITTFDTADAYSAGRSEEILGRTLRACVSRRDEVVIATKVGLPVGGQPGGLRPERMEAALDASLRRLGLSHVDLWQLHGWDGDVPISETMGAMARAVQAGKARHVGASNFAAWQAALCAGASLPQAPLTAMQLQLNLLYREEEREMLPFCRYAGVGVIAYSPLARGRLAGPPQTPEESLRAGTDAKAERLYGDVHDHAVVQSCRALAARRGVAPSVIALAWLLRTPGVDAAIIGATSAEQLRAAAGATELTLDPAERVLLEAHYTPRAAETGDLSGSVR